MKSKLLYFCFIFLHFFLVAYGEESLTHPPAHLPVRVKTGFYLLNFTSINEKDQTFLADVYFSFRWNDSRLSFQGEKPHIFLDDAAKDKLNTIWKPQIEFINAIHPLYKNRVLFIHPNGDIEYLISITSNFYTGLNFKRFPFDSQVLTIRIDSFAWNNSIVVFEPATLEGHMFNRDNLKSFEEHIIDIQETEKSLRSGPVVEYFAKNDLYSTYIVNITVQRKSGYFLFQVFIPLFLVMGMSCLVFFGDSHAFLDKVMINLTAFLVLLATKFTINLNLPEIDDLTMIDKSFLTAYICIGLTVAVNTLETILGTKHKLIEKINNYARWAIFLLFISTIIIIYLLS